MTQKLKEACIISQDNWVNNIVIDNTFEESLSNDFLKSIKKINNKMRNNKYHYFSKQTSRIVLIAAILFSMATVAFAVPYTRNYIVQQYKNHSTIAVVTNSSSISNIEIQYISDNYILYENFEADNFVVVSYCNVDNYFSVYKCADGSVINYNSEDAITETVLFDDVYYRVCKNEVSDTVVLFEKNDYFYMVVGNLDLDEIIKISENLN